jgi:hypothetical protein
MFCPKETLFYVWHCIWVTYLLLATLMRRCFMLGWQLWLVHCTPVNHSLLVIITLSTQQAILHGTVQHSNPQHCTVPIMLQHLDLFSPQYCPVTLHNKVEDLFIDLRIKSVGLDRFFSKHRPSGPMLSISRNVRLSVCLSVCVSVHFWGTV